MDSSENPLVRPTPLADQAYDRLRAAIVSGELAPGERLVERELSRRMGASRTPMREALIRLEHEGLLTARASGGLVVTELDESEVRELYAIRSVLEGYAAKLAAGSISDAAVKRLHAIVELENEKLDPLDKAALEELNDQFHKELYAASSMPRLTELINTLRQQSVNYRVYDIYTPAETAVLLSHHSAILDAVERNNPELADALIRDHLTMASEILTERRVTARRDET